MIINAHNWPGFDSCFWHGLISWWNHTSDIKTDTLPDTWRYRVSSRTTVSTLWLVEIERLICNFYISEAAHTLVWADPSPRDTLASMPPETTACNWSESNVMCKHHQQNVTHESQAFPAAYAFFRLAMTLIIIWCQALCFSLNGFAYAERWEYWEK